MNKFLIVIIFISTTFGQSFKDLTERPIYNPIKIEKPILFDGIVDSKEWSKAQVATNFNGSGTFQGQPSDLRTEARLFYDDKNIYVGF